MFNPNIQNIYTIGFRNSYGNENNKLFTLNIITDRLEPTPGRTKEDMILALIAAITIDYTYPWDRRYLYSNGIYQPGPFFKHALFDAYDHPVGLFKQGAVSRYDALEETRNIITIENNTISFPDGSIYPMDHFAPFVSLAIPYGPSSEVQNKTRKTKHDMISKFVNTDFGFAYQLAIGILYHLLPLPYLQESTEYSKLIDKISCVTCRMAKLMQHEDRVNSTKYFQSIFTKTNDIFDILHANLILLPDQYHLPTQIATSPHLEEAIKHIDPEWLCLAKSFANHFEKTPWVKKPPLTAATGKADKNLSNHQKIQTLKEISAIDRMLASNIPLHMLTAPARRILSSIATDHSREYITT